MYTKLSYLALRVIFLLLINCDSQIHAWIRTVTAQLGRKMELVRLIQM